MRHPERPEFSVDWLSPYLGNWHEHLSPFQGQPDLAFMEIDSFEGRSTRWLLENILTHPTSHIVCVDTFQGNTEHGLLNIDVSDLAARFERNIVPFRSKVTIHHGESSRVLRSENFKDASFDFIYIDGSHYSWDVLTDIVLSWPLLKQNGLLFLDDYGWIGSDHPMNRPRIAIDAFLRVFNGKFHILFKGFQLGLVKRESKLTNFAIDDIRNQLQETGRLILPPFVRRPLRRLRQLFPRR